MLAASPKQWQEKIHKLIPAIYLTNPMLASLRNELHEEVNVDYEFSLRKAIGNSVTFLFLPMSLCFLLFMKTFPICNLKIFIKIYRYYLQKTKTYEKLIFLV